MKRKIKTTTTTIIKHCGDWLVKRFEIFDIFCIVKFSFSLSEPALCTKRTLNSVKSHKTLTEKCRPFMLGSVEILHKERMSDASQTEAYYCNNNKLAFGSLVENIFITGVLLANGLKDIYACCRKSRARYNSRLNSVNVICAKPISSHSLWLEKIVDEIDLSPAFDLFVFNGQCGRWFHDKNTRKLALNIFFIQHLTKLIPYFTVWMKRCNLNMSVEKPMSIFTWSGRVLQTHPWISAQSNLYVWMGLIHEYAR